MKVVLTCCVCRLLQGGAGVGRHQLDGQRRVFGSDREGKRVESTGPDVISDAGRDKDCSCGAF